MHTNYALAATPTGRLSSSEPNLQNIPIRTEEGRKIRRAFVSTPGNKLVSADYSQIELRLLAEIADVPALRQAFTDGLDIHAMTASEMFGVPIKGMPADVRRRAKAINFGIIYGISAFGLANQLAIPREEAGAYIKKYFERFPGIRDYMDETKAAAKKNGYVVTLFGRKCHYPDIANSNPSVRAFNERAAINARLQGSAADIIRRAMIRMEDALAEEEARRANAAAGARRTGVRGAGGRSREDPAGDQARDGRRTASRHRAESAARGRCARRGQLGRGALTRYPQAWMFGRRTARANTALNYRRACSTRRQVEDERKTWMIRSRERLQQWSTIASSKGVRYPSRMFGAIVALFAILWSEPSLAATLDGRELGFVWALPFIGILLSIALGPLLAAHTWEHHQGKIAAGWALLTAVPLWFIAGPSAASHAFVHTVLSEYIPFILLLLALFTVAGGIVVRGNLHGSPVVNTCCLPSALSWQALSAQRARRWS